MGDTLSAEQQYDWTALVQAGRKVASDINSSQWLLGKYAIQAAAVGPHGGSSLGTLDRVRAYAGEIGVPFETVDRYRKTVNGWTEGNRFPSVSFSAHQVALGSINPPVLLRNLLVEAEGDGALVTKALVREKVRAERQSAEEAAADDPSSPGYASNAPDEFDLHGEVTPSTLPDIVDWADRIDGAASQLRGLIQDIDEHHDVLWQLNDHQREVLRRQLGLVIDLAESAARRLSDEEAAQVYADWSASQQPDGAEDTVISLEQFKERRSD